MPGVFGAVGGDAQRRRAAFARLTDALGGEPRSTIRQVRWPHAELGVALRPAPDGEAVARVGRHTALLEGWIDGLGDATALARAVERDGTAMLGGLDGWHTGCVASEGASAGAAGVAGATSGGVVTVFQGFLGLEPLYVAERDGLTVFGPRAAALPAALGRRARLDGGGCCDLLLFGHPLGEATVFDGVRRLPPGQALRIDADGTRSLVAAPPAASPCDAHGFTDWLRERWPQLVRRAADRPGRLGALLSGGLDSRAVALALPADTPLFTFGRHGALDVRLAAQVASARGAPHTVLPLPDAFLAAQAPPLLARLEGMVNPCHAPGAATNGPIADAVDALASGSFGDVLMGTTVRTLPADADDRVCLRATLAPLRRRDRELLLEPAWVARRDAALDEHVDPAWSQRSPAVRARHYVFAHRIRRFIAAGVADRRHWTATVHPFYARELFAAVDALPAERWAGGAAYWASIVALDGRAARVPWARTGVPFDAGDDDRARIARQRRRRRNRLRWRRYLRLGRPDPDRFLDVDHLLRSDTANRRFLAEQLAQPALAALPFVRADGVSRLLAAHRSGRRDHATVLGRLVALAWLAGRFDGAW